MEKASYGLPNKDSHPLEGCPDFLPADAAVSVHVQCGKHKSEHRKYILQYSSHIGSVYVGIWAVTRELCFIGSRSKIKLTMRTRERYWRVRNPS